MLAVEGMTLIYAVLGVTACGLVVGLHSIRSPNSSLWKFISKWDAAAVRISEPVRENVTAELDE